MNIFSKKNKDKRASFSFKSNTRSPPPPANILLFDLDESPRDKFGAKNDYYRPRSQIVSHNVGGSKFTGYKAAGTTGAYENAIGFGYQGGLQASISEDPIKSNNGQSFSPYDSVGRGPGNNTKPQYNNTASQQTDNTQYHFNAGNKPGNNTRKKPPLRSPSEYQRARFEHGRTPGLNINDLVEIENKKRKELEQNSGPGPNSGLSRMDTISRRQSIRNAKLKEKNLPQLPPKPLNEGIQWNQQGVFGTLELPVQKPLKSTDQRSFSLDQGLSHDVSATQFPPRSFSYNHETSASQDSFMNLTAANINVGQQMIPSDLPIPQRSEKRSSVINLSLASSPLTPATTGGYSLSHTNTGSSGPDYYQIPPRSNRRVSKYLPFNSNNKAEKQNVESTFNVISGRKLSSDLNSSSGDNLTSLVPQSQTEPPNIIGSFQPPEPIGQATPMGLLQNNDSKESLVQPLGTDFSIDSVMKDLWTPVQTLKSYEDEAYDKKIRAKSTFLQPTPEEDLELPSNIQSLGGNGSIAGSYNKNATSAASITNLDSYQITDDVLNFGDSFDVTNILKEVHSIEEKIELRNKLERSATKKLNRVLKTYNDSKNFQEAAHLRRELTKIASDYPDQKKHPATISKEEAGSDIDKSLEKYFLINEFLDRKDSLISEREESVISELESVSAVEFPVQETYIASTVDENGDETQEGVSFYESPFITDSQESIDSISQAIDATFNGSFSNSSSRDNSTSSIELVPSKQGHKSQVDVASSITNRTSFSNVSENPVQPTITRGLVAASQSVASSVTNAVSPVGTVVASFDDYYLQRTDSEETINIINFAASSLETYHFKQCREVWSLSGIFRWFLKIDKWFVNQAIRKKEVVNSLYLLLTFHFPKMGSVAVYAVIADIMEDFEKLGCLCESAGPEDEDPSAPVAHVNSYEDMVIVTFNKLIPYPSGVFTSLLPCYSTSYSDDSVPIEGLQGTCTCYSTCCPEEKKKIINIPAPSDIVDPSKLKKSWVLQWNIEQSELAGLDNYVIELHSRNYDLIKKQYEFVNEAEYLVHSIGEKFMQDPRTESFAYPLKKEELYYSMFKPIEPLIAIHKKYLLGPMMKVLLNQGKFIKSGIYELYFDWTEASFPKYIEYLGHLAEVILILDFEKLKKSSEFIDWLDEFPRLPLPPNKLLSNYFFYSLIQYKDSLKDIKHRTSATDPQMPYLEEAIVATTMFCEKLDEIFGQCQVNAILRKFQWGFSRLGFNILLDPEFMELKAREVISRKAGGGIWAGGVSGYLLLFNNCLVISELNLEERKFLVKERPIPIQFVAIETLKASDFDSEQLTGPRLNTDHKPSEWMKLIHIGRNTSFTIKFRSTTSKNLWQGYIRDGIKARISRNTREIKFNTILTDALVSDSNLFYYKLSSLPIVKAASNHIQYTSCPPSVKKIYCAVKFELKGQKYYLVSTSAGLLLRNHLSPWKKVDKIDNVTQMAYLEESHLLLILADKKFLQVMASDIIDKAQGISLSMPVIKLSNQNVDFFGGGYVNRTYYLFYMKSKLTNSGATYRMFKALILQPRGIQFQSSLEYENFFMTSICLSLTTFHEHIILGTETGFQMIDRKLRPIFIPRSMSSKLLKNAGKEANFFRQLDYRKTHEKTVASFSINNDKEILVVFSTFACFCNARGYLSKPRFLEFNSQCNGAALRDTTLVVFTAHSMELYDLLDGDPGVLEPFDFIVGDGIELLSNGQNEIVFTANNPDNGTKMILEMV